MALRIRSYWAIREESVRRIGSGKKFVIATEGLPEDSDIIIFWGTTPLELLTRTNGQRLHVVAPQVENAQTLPIWIQIKTTGQTVSGPLMTIFPVPAGMSISFGTPLAED